MQIEIKANPIGYKASLGTEIKNNYEKIEKIGKTSNPDYDRFNETINFSFKFDNVKDRVKSIIKFDSYARRNYLWLDILYYQKMGMLKLIVPLEDFAKANSPETINRAFRKLIEETEQGLHPDLNFILKDKILELRNRQKEKFEDMFSMEKNSKIAEIIK